MLGIRLFYACILALLVLSTSCSNTSYCPEGLSWCWAQCVDLMANNQNCGECNSACSESEACIDGQCETVEVFCDYIGELEQLGAYDLPDYAYDIEVVGEQAYIADGEGGLQIINISDPTNPTYTSELFSGFGALGIDVQGSHAYIAYADDGLYVIDISDPSAPDRIGYSPSGGFRFHDLSVVEETAYVAWDYHDGGGGMKIYDVSNPARPTSEGYCETGQHAIGITVEGKFAYIANGSRGIYTIELLKPESPLGSYDTPGNAHAIAVEGNFGYIADGFGLQIIDISNRRYPSFVAEHDLQEGVSNIVVKGKYAYLGGSESFHIVDIRDPSNPFVVKTSAGISSGITGLDVRGNLAYLGGRTLQIVKVCE